MLKSSNLLTQFDRLIPFSLKTRFYRNGQLRNQLKAIKKIYFYNKKSVIAKYTWQLIRRKFWLADKKATYEHILSTIWKFFIYDENQPVVNFNFLKMVNDFRNRKNEVTDIFMADTIFTNLCFSPEERVAADILNILSKKEGPYQTEKVCVNRGDIVIDAGANIGLFSLVSLAMGASKVYAFEPQIDIIDRYLSKNIDFNNGTEIIKIIPQALDSIKGIKDIYYSKFSHVAASIVIHENEQLCAGQVQCIDLDSWVLDNKISKIDFIKADIEGAERYMLIGATNVLKNMAPRLAICTYHFADDKDILEEIILKANPNYIIHHSSHKLYAYVPEP